MSWGNEFQCLSTCDLCMQSRARGQKGEEGKKSMGTISKEPGPDLEGENMTGTAESKGLMFQSAQLLPALLRGLGLPAQAAA